MGFAPPTTDTQGIVWVRKLSGNVDRQTGDQLETGGSRGADGQVGKVGNG